MFLTVLILSMLTVCNGLADTVFTSGQVPQVYFLFFHQVSLEYQGKHVCGGSIVSSNHIVTAAQCVKDRSVDLLTVRVAFLNDSLGERVHRAENYTIHEGYKEIRYGIPVNDIAVVRVSEPFKKSRLSEPIGMFNKSDVEIESGTVAYANSWGEMKNGSMTPEPQIWSTQIIASNICSEALKFLGGLPSGKICTWGGKGACPGDEGTALTIRKRLVGIVSWTGRFCGYYRPVVYTKIADYGDWIAEKIKS